MLFADLGYRFDAERQERDLKLSRRQSLKTLAAVSVLPAGYVSAAAAATGKARPIRLVILDIGGTLIQDHGEVPNAMHSALANRGIEVSFAEIGEWRGASKRGMVRHFVELRAKQGAEKDALTETIYGDFSAQVNRAYANVQPIAGAEDAIHAMRQAGFMLATTTGFDRQQTNMILGKLGWHDEFVASITSDDVVDGRPSPFMLFHAMEAAHVDSVAEVVAAGDTPLDLQAASNAGVRGIVGVFSGAATAERLQKEPHTHILASVAGLPALLRAGF
jgi:phosphonatase-like hydrolase